MPLHDLVLEKSSFLELPIDIAGEHERTERSALTPPAEDLETAVRDRGPVEVHAVAEEAPRQRRISSEPVRSRHFGERTPAERRVRLPKPFRPAEVGQTGIHPHARAGPDQQGVGSSDGVGCRLYQRVRTGLLIHRRSPRHYDWGDLGRRSLLQLLVRRS